MVMNPRTRAARRRVTMNPRTTIAATRTRTRMVGDTGPHHHKHIERALKHIEKDEYQRCTYQSDICMCLLLHLPFLSLCCYYLSVPKV